MKITETVVRVRTPKTLDFPAARHVDCLQTMASRVAATGAFLFEGKFRYQSETNKKIVECVTCKATMKYHHSTSSLKYHYSCKHPFYQPKPSSSEASTPASTSNPKPPPKQSSILSFAQRSLTNERKQGVTKRMALWIASAGRPVNIVEDSGLQSLMQYALENDGYTAPSRRTISKRLDAIYAASKAEVEGMLELTSDVGLTADYWTSCANESYLGVTAHFLTPGMQLVSKALGVRKTEERHTADQIALQISEICREWNIEEKLRTVGTDNASNMVNAVKKLGPTVQLVPCAAHSLQLGVRKAIDASGIDNVLAKVRKVVGHVKHSPHALTQLHALQKDHGEPKQALIQDVSTRWNSTFAMIERFLMHHESITALIEAKENIRGLTSAEWEKLRALKLVLEPCKEATEDLGGSKYVSCSMILPVVNLLKRKMNASDDDPAYICRFKEKLVSTLNCERYCLGGSFAQIACALDPRFKSLKCMPSDLRVGVWSEVERLLAVELESSQGPAPTQAKKSRFDFSDEDSDNEEPMEGQDNEVHHLQAEKVLSVYRSQTALGDMCNPLEWWNGQGTPLSSMLPLVRRYLGSPATSVPCERLFSTAGIIVSKKRASLLPDNVNMLVCLNNWLDR